MIPLPGWAVVSAERRAHIERVADLATSWCDAWKLPAPERARVLRAVTLHDALRDAPLVQLTTLSRIDWHTPELLHGPAAAERARQDGEQDRGVLDAVCYHTVGWAGWDQPGRVLYLADYLEPGRTFDRAGRAALAKRVIDDMPGALQAVAQARIAWVTASGWPLLKETVEFWNALVAGD